MQELLINHHQLLEIHDYSSLIELYERYDVFFKTHEDGHGFTRGKYKLIYVILLRYSFENFNIALSELRPQKFAYDLYVDLFVREEHYIAKFEG